ncbi:hypothetical protein Tco_0958098 [Tanacetum coccineum]
MSNVEDSSFHNNIGRRMMSPELEDHYPWEEIKSSSIDICRPFIKFLALGWHLEEIHVTWAHLEKKRTRLRLYTIYLEELCIQSVETAS